MVSAMFSCLVTVLFLFSSPIVVDALPRPNGRFGRSLLSEESVLEARELVRRAPSASPCSKLDLDDAQSLPGWSKLEKYARSTWGEGDWDIVINPPGYKDKPATMCVADPVKVVIAGPSQCNETRKDIPPEKKDGTTIKVDEGYRNTGNWNITNVTTAAHALFFSGNFQLPNITQLHLGALQAPGKFINAPQNSFTTFATNVTYKNTELTPVPDKRCIGTILEQECLTPATGRIQLIATGYIWFHYKTKRAPLANPKGGKHSKYVVRIEDVLKNATERSGYIDFNGYMNTTWRYDYFDECRWNFKL